MDGQVARFRHAVQLAAAATMPRLGEALPMDQVGA
jgi:hypothetical protein